MLSVGGGAGFTGGRVHIAEGTFRATSNTSLGSGPSSQADVYFGGALEVNVSNFVPTVGTLVFHPGSVERWSVEDARGNAGTYTLAPGQNLQLATNLVTGTRTIELQGGSVWGYLSSDDLSVAVFRTAEAGISWNLLADSFVGRNLPAGINANFIDETKGVPTSLVQNQNTLDLTGATLEIRGAISGPFDLTKVGTDIVTLSGPNTYQNTRVHAGLLRTGAVNTLPAGGTLFTHAGGVLDLNGFAQTVANLGDETGTLGYCGTIFNSAYETAVLTVGSAANSSYAGELVGNLRLVKQGSGTQTLLGNNPYTDGTEILAGILAAGANEVLGTGDLTVNGPSAQFQMTTFNEHVDNLILVDGQITGTSGVLRAQVFDVRQGSISAILGDRTVPSSQPTALVKSTAGLVTLSGVNTFSGGVTIQAGTLSVAADNHLGAATNDPTFTADGATLQATGSFSTNRDLTLDLLGSGDLAHLDVAGAGTSLTAHGTIVGTGGFNKSGDGQLTLANTTLGSYDFTGAVTINGGRLHVASGATLDGDLGVFVHAGGNLTGTGTIDDSVTVHAGGKINPGDSPGALTISGFMGGGSSAGLTLNGNGAFTQPQSIFDVDAIPSAGSAGVNWDVINVTDAIDGVLTINATPSDPFAVQINSMASLITGFDPTSTTPYQWLWIHATGGVLGYTGSNQFVIDSSNVFGTGAPYTLPPAGGFFYVSADTNNLYMNYAAVPEPGTLLLTAVGMLCGAGIGYARRRGRRAASAADDRSTPGSGLRTHACVKDV